MDGILQFDENQWRAFPESDDGSFFLTALAIQNKTVKFSLSIYGVDEESNTEIKLGRDKTISMLYCAGEPRSIAMMQPGAADGDITAVNGEGLPPILLACLDEWGNRTAPRPGMTWQFIVEENDWISGGKAHAAQVLPTGEAWLKGLSLNPSEDLFPREGVSVSITVRLHCDFGPEDADPRDMPTIAIPLTVVPSTFPDNVEVSRG